MKLICSGYEVRENAEDHRILLGERKEKKKEAILKEPFMHIS